MGGSDAERKPVCVRPKGKFEETRFRLRRAEGLVVICMLVSDQECMNLVRSTGTDCGSLFSPLQTLSEFLLRNRWTSTVFPCIVFVQNFRIEFWSFSERIIRIEMKKNTDSLRRIVARYSQR